MKEIFHNIPGYENIYQVSNLGRIKSLCNPSGTKKEKIIKSWENQGGYIEVGLHKNGVIKFYKVHRLVAVAFISNYGNKPEVNHINGNKKDNRIENLEWCTRSENLLHSLKIGTHKRLSNGLFN